MSFLDDLDTFDRDEELDTVEEVSEGPWPKPDPLIPAADLPPGMWRRGWRDNLRTNWKFFNYRLRTGELTQSHLYYIDQEAESDFELVEGFDDAPLTGEAVRREVGLGQKTCPLCNGEELMHLLHRGKNTGVLVRIAFTCPCASLSRFYRKWVEDVGPDHQDCTPNTIWRPTFLSRFPADFTGEVRHTVRGAVRYFNGYNILIAGPAGTGKTTIMTALYYTALEKWVQNVAERGVPHPALYKLNTRVLADMQQAWETREKGGDSLAGPSVPAPPIQSGDIKTIVGNGFVPRLFLDEFDKYKLNSDFQNPVFHTLIDTICQAQGQVVAVSNLTLDELRYKIPEQYADPILRRLVGLPRGLYIDMKERRVYLNRAEIRWKGDLRTGGLIYTGQMLAFAPETKNGKLKTPGRGTPVLDGDGRLIEWWMAEEPKTAEAPVQVQASTVEAEAPEAPAAPAAPAPAKRTPGTNRGDVFVPVATGPKLRRR